MDKKVNRGEYLGRVAKRVGKDYSQVLDVYNAMVAELVDIAKAGERLSLTGFGLFYVQQHKGHPVQFSGDVEKVSDYAVLKFSASNVMNKKLRDNGIKLVKNESENESELESVVE